MKKIILVLAVMLFTSAASAQVAPSTQNLAEAQRAAIENAIHDEKLMNFERMEQLKKEKDEKHNRIRKIDEQIAKSIREGKPVKQLEEQRRLLLENLGAKGK